MLNKQPVTRYLTSQEAAEYLSISLIYARLLMRQGKIKASNSGRWRTTEQDLINYIEGNK